MGVADLFLNKGPSAEKAVVQAPAFSLTKVMAVVAPVVTAVAALAINALPKLAFTSGQITAMIVALIAFLAVTASADVLARSIATAAEKRANGRSIVVRFGKPLKARLETGNDGHRDIRILAASDAVPPEYLCLAPETEKVSWERAERITGLAITQGPISSN